MRARREHASNAICGISHLTPGERHPPQRFWLPIRHSLNRELLRTRHRSCASVQRRGRQAAAVGRRVRTVGFTDVELGTGPDGALLLRNLVVYPSVMTLNVLALFRRPLMDGPGTAGHNCPMFWDGRGVTEVGTGFVLFGLRFSDASTYRNRVDSGDSARLGTRGGGGGSVIGTQEFWAPVPPPGDFEIWVAWPAAAIPETRTVLDGTRVHDAATALTPFWT